MGLKFNPFTGTLDYVNSDRFQGVLASAPSGAQEGWTYINSVDYGFYLYAGGIWWRWTTLTPTSSSDYNILLEDGGSLLYENNDYAITENALPSSTSSALLETGDDILLETGDRLFLEDSAPSIPSGNNGILLESGDYLIGEDGGPIDLEDGGGGPTPGVNDFIFIAADTFEFMDSTTFEVI